MNQAQAMPTTLFLEPDGSYWYGPTPDVAWYRARWMARHPEVTEEQFYHLLWTAAGSSLDPETGHIHLGYDLPPANGPFEPKLSLFYRMFQWVRTSIVGGFAVAAVFLMLGMVVGPVLAVASDMIGWSGGQRGGYEAVGDYPTLGYHTPARNSPSDICDDGLYHEQVIVFEEDVTCKHTLQWVDSHSAAFGVIAAFSIGSILLAILIGILTLIAAPAVAVGVPVKMWRDAQRRDDAVLTGMRASMWVNPVWLRNNAANYHCGVCGVPSLSYDAYDHRCVCNHCRSRFEVVHTP